jgi:hypothetical protein
MIFKFQLLMMISSLLTVSFGLMLYYLAGLRKNAAVSDCKQQFTRGSLFDIGTKYATDKVYAHHYEHLYEKYVSRYRDTAVRLFEIGLGCGMQRGTGASAKTWREYFGPKADIHFLEFNEICGREWETMMGKKVRSVVFNINV